MVRATFAGFSTALSALQANQKRLDITGQNLSNMNTVGYTRQQLDVSSLNYSGGVSHNMNGAEAVVGFGVRMDGVSQLRDPYLDMQYRLQMAKADYSNGLQTGLDALSNVLDESKISGLRQAFADIQSSLTAMQESQNAHDPVYEGELRTRMQALATLLNQSSVQISEAEKAGFDRISGNGTSEQGAVEKINDILRQVGDLNVRIKQNQVAGQPSLELMDERNNLLDTLSSYVPIEVTSYKDGSHSGTYTYTAPDGTTSQRDYAYDYDAHGRIIGKRQWPEDVRVDLVYTDANGAVQKLNLVNGSDRGADGMQKNYGQLEALKASDGAAPDRSTPTDLAVRFTAAQSGAVNPDGTPAQAPAITAAANGAQFSGGSLQAELDMLGKTGTGAVIAGTATKDDVRGYQFYQNELDKLASAFAKKINDLNKAGQGGILLTDKTQAADTETGITASNIGVSAGWTNGSVHIGNGTNSSADTVVNMLEAMKKPQGDLDDNTYADYMNHIAAQLATDSSANQTALKTNVTVLNAIQNSKDSVSGVSLDEEAANMMTYVSAYNAASRLMTALDEVLNTLISNTGLVGR